MCPTVLKYHRVHAHNNTQHVHAHLVFSGGGSVRQHIDWKHAVRKSAEKNLQHAGTLNQTM